MIKSNIFRCITSFASILLAAGCLFFCNFVFASDLLSAEERAWLQRHPDIRVAISPDYPPIGFLDNRGKPAGLEQDYLTLLEKRLGVHFNQVIPTIAQRAADSPIDKQADVVAIFAVTEERTQRWRFTKTFLDLPVYLITQDNSLIKFSLDNVQNQRVSSVGHYASSDYLKNKYPDVQIDKVDDTCIGLQHVSIGESAGMLADLPVANWCAEKFGLRNLKIAGATGFHYEIGAAVRKDWPELHSILEKGLNSISQKERDDMYLRWNNNSLERSQLNQYKNWIFLAMLAFISYLLYRLYQWDTKLKGALDMRHFKADGNKSFSETQSIQVGMVTKKVKQTNLVYFGLMLVLIFAAFAFTYDYFDKKDNFLLSIIELVLIVLGIVGGFMLGSLQRRFEADHYFNQMLSQTSRREVVESKLNSSEQRLALQQNTLTKLTQSQLRDWQTHEEVFKEIAEQAAETLNVERVSLWLFSNKNDQLDCVTMYSKAKRHHLLAKPLQATFFPNYFEQVSKERVIVANDALNHPAMAELKQLGYLAENKIGAMLDGTIWLGGEAIGVICVEHIGAPREWTLDEQNFVGSLCDLARVTMSACKRRDAEQALIKQSNMLEKMVQQRTQSLLETEKRFGYVVNHAPISILIISHEGEIVEANPEAVIASGYTRDEMLGKNFISLLVAPESRLKAVEMAAMTLKGHEYRGLELMLQRKDGQKFEYDCSVGMAANEQMGQGQIVAIAQDVTQKKALATNLIKAREAAESADRIKSMFVASMSHELRTPLNSIIGFLGVVLQGMSGELNLKQKDQLGRAYGSARHLLSLISDVIDISKIEAGYLQTHVEKFNLKPLLIEVEQAVLHLAEEKRIEVTIACSAKLSLETDRKRLYQVVLNVVSNAVKYTEKGSVSVVAELKNDQVRIAVKDTGIGIDAEDLDHLFRPFERVESRLKIKTLGTGLGLYLTRKILNQLLDGKITVVSKPEIGSTFTVTIPSIIKPILAQPAKSILEDTSV